MGLAKDDRDRASRTVVRRGADGPIQAGAMARQITHIKIAMPVSVSSIVLILFPKLQALAKAASSCLCPPFNTKLGRGAASRRQQAGDLRDKVVTKKIIRFYN